ncbi:NAD(P)-binding protein [Aspergillus sclerotiicarbonarius CBS 121057]|uniref:NAD(P)-binding protein n=1 Tax=Aspergillus sclerotiicarbonarius (strain CBS 121057 / IBT 28362) TaxID=1448318 RepID=A0A319DTU4_ASPSB|nr:NAD(P)-binding protein [Aspergillus sclerotiicarbonarius CBS 121057]
MKIALLGSTGQVGQSILRALLTTTPYHVLQIVSPRSEPTALTTAQTFTPDQQARLTTKALDLVTCSTDDLVSMLTNTSIIISVLNGPALASQSRILDAAAIAGVKRFYPSEYGMHCIYQPLGEECGYVHPTWMAKITATDQCLHHPSIASGDITYTLIGCGDIYNQSREETWCPWTNPSPTLPSYTVYMIGNPDAKVDFTLTDDLAAFIVETVRYPELSENKELNVVSDRLSYNEIAGLLERVSGREVKRVVFPGGLVDEVLRDGGNVPREVKGEGEGGRFGDDFWILVRGIQGQGRFVRPVGMVHNGVFGGIEVRGRKVEGYLEELFGGK